MTKEEIFLRIRRDSWREGLSVRALARKYGVHRRLVREALSSPTPKPRRPPVRRSPRLDPYKKTVDDWLRADLEAPKKQRHTVKRIVARLQQELGADVPYTTLRDYVSLRRPQIAVEAGAPAEGFIVRHNRPGADAEVDFGDVWVNLNGTVTKCYLFAFRLAYSGKSVHRISMSCGQQAFLEGHVHALSVLGGVPTGQVRYDNLTPAVSRVIFRSRSREESPRWASFHAHYGFIPFYCEPGLRGAHEKGGVEGQVGYFRRNYLTPVPAAESLDELNSRLQECERIEDGRRIGLRIRTIGQDFTHEAALLMPLPDEAFETGLVLTPRVDRYAMVTVKMCRYSVPVRFIGHQARVVLQSAEVVIHVGRSEIARHPRLTGRGEERLVLDHYLEVLLRKPGALAGSEALDQARIAGAFTAAHEALWAKAKAELGDTEGTKALVEVLLLHRHLDHADVIVGIRAALSVGSVAHDIVALEARKAAEASGRSPTVTAPVQEPRLPDEASEPQVTSLTMRRVAQLPGDSRPLPALDAWDQLLRVARKEPS
ncbi:IS21 family transposase [Streptomyces sp. MNP-20]|uniref:IS21 family transposase n=1 Tax=Streptomyces sp. MNP-20 TaxID=2721165 RepID=UPI00155443BB|nr:IS21 family transposase [Streptomyces sp. MNP-20]